MHSLKNLILYKLPVEKMPIVDWFCLLLFDFFLFKSFEQMCFLINVNIKNSRSYKKQPNATCLKSLT